MKWAIGKKGYVAVTNKVSKSPPKKVPRSVEVDEFLSFFIGCLAFFLCQKYIIGNNNWANNGNKLEGFRNWTSLIPGHNSIENADFLE